MVRCVHGEYGRGLAVDLTGPGGWWKEDTVVAPRHTILIADDELGIRELVYLTIADPRYLVLEAADGDEARCGSACAARPS